MSEQEVVEHECICDDAGSTECNGTDKICIEKQIEKKKMKRKQREAARYYTKRIDTNHLIQALGYRAVDTSFKKRMRKFELEKLIFNLLVKAWRNKPIYDKHGEKIHTKYARTREAFSLAYKIQIHIDHKHMFRITGLSLTERLDLAMIRFNTLLGNQFNKEVTVTRKGMFILEKRWTDEEEEENDN